MKRQQRAINLETAKKSLNKFDSQVKQNRRSERIDLVQEEIANRGNASTLSTSGLVSTTDAVTDFEKEFRRAIEESGLNWNDNSAAQLPPAQEIQAHNERSQLARIRTLMRAEQIRAHRLKKIKSKTYRKLIRKKEMKGMQDLIAKLDKEDPEAAEKIKAELERKLSSLRLNRQRQARIKWSKAAERFGGREIRSEISRQAQAQEDEKRELIRAIKGRTDRERSDSEDDDSDDSASVSDDDDDIVSKVKKAINAKVLGGTGSSDSSTLPQKGLLGMKFMREADTRKRNETVAEAKNFLDTLENDDIDDAAESDAEDNQPDQQVSDEKTEDTEASQQALVASLFGAAVPETSKKSTSSKKTKSMTVEQPKEGDEMPGWGSWIGEGVRNKRKRKTEIEPATTKTSSKPSAIVHALDSSAVKAPLMKYQVKDIPYPYKSREEYEAANSMPLGPDWQSLTAHSEAVQPKICARLGAVVPPLRLAKHLDSDKRAKLIDAWDKRKRPQHTKARFL